jgi:hypothetical protein
MLPKRLLRAVQAAVGVLAALVFWRLARVSWWHLTFPFDLAYESTILATIQALKAHLPIYDPALYAAPPCVLTMYPPLYHWLASLLPAPAANPFLPGRALGAAAMLASGACLFRGKEPRWLPVLAAAAFFSMDPVPSNTALLKNDSLGLLFSVAAVLWAEAGPGKPRVFLTSFLCLLAFACKQSFVSAGLACFLFFLGKDVRRAALFAVLTGVQIGLFCLAMTRWEGRGFWFCVAGALDVPYSWDVFRTNWGQMLRQPVFIAITASCAAVAALVVREKGWRGALAGPLPLYAAISCLTLPSLAKLGAATNYFFEPVLAALLCFVRAAGGMWEEEGRRRAVLWAAVPLLAGLAIDAAAFGPRAKAFAWPEIVPNMEASRRALREEFKDLGPAPRFLNLYNTRLRLDLPGPVDVSDPYLSITLWHGGKLDPAPLVEAVDGGLYDAVILASDERPAREYGADPYGAVLAAVERRYRFKRAGPRIKYYVRR